MQKIIFFIGARAGSKGLKNKNIKIFFGKPLIYWTIKQALKSRFCDKIIISSDSDKILKLCSKISKKIIPILRPKKLSTDNSGKFLAWKHAIKKYEKITNSKIDFLVDLDCTNPLRYKKDIDSLVSKAIKIKNLDAMVTIADSRKNPYFNMIEIKKNILKPSKKLKNWPVRRQDAPSVFDQVASIYCLRGKFVINHNNIYQGKVYGYKLKDFQVYDIDSKLDFEIIKFLFKKYKSKLMR
tara:strand:- start:2626 stop:3342 length:717 start_codon:yes stop_codon:yes gene_type:complete